MHRLLTFVSILLSAAALAANDSSSAGGKSSSPPLQQKIVVTASAIPESVLNTPASIDVITRDDIVSRAARDVATVLRDVSGLELATSGSQGKATSLFSRGANSNQTLVLWNGVQINDPYFSGFDWGRFSTAGVESVEVVKGPYSALYGSDAGAGVVNILTIPQTSLVRGDASTGERGLFNGALSGSWIASPLAFSASAEHRTDGGWFLNDDFKQDSALFSTRWTTAADALAVHARYSRYETGIPFNLNGDLTQLVASPSRREKGTEMQLALPYDRMFGVATAHLRLSESRRDDSFVDPDDPFGLLETETKSTTRRAELSAEIPSRIGRIVAGGETERAIVDDRSTYGVNLDNARRSSTGFFVEDRISRSFTSSEFEASIGLRRDDFDTFGAHTSPRIAAALVAGSGKWRVAYGEGFRAPSVGELYYPFSGNRTLGAETSRNVEAGYDRFVGRGRASVTVFRTSYDHLIFFDNSTFQFQNINAARSAGVELSFDTPLSQSFSAGGSYSFIRTSDRETGRQLLRRPKNVASLHTTFTHGSARLVLIGRYSGGRPDVLPVSPFGRIWNEPYATGDVAFAYEVRNVTPYIRVENVADARYAEVAGYPAPRRRALIGVQFTTR